MNREEAINILKQRQCCRECVADCKCEDCDKAFEMAIEALENQTLAIEELEKIKARIDEEVAYVNKWQVKNDSIKIIDERISELKGENIPFKRTTSPKFA